MDQDKAGPPLTSLALLLCEHAHQDEVSGQFSLIGLRDRVEADAYPLTLTGGDIYFAFAVDRRVQITLTLRMIDMELERPPVCTADFFFDGTGGIGSAEFSLPLTGAVVPTPGVYFLEAHANGHQVAQRRVEFLQSGESDEEH